MRLMRRERGVMLNKFIALILTGSMFAVNLAFAQEATETIKYQSGRKSLPNPFNVYFPTDVTAPKLTNTPRIDQLFQNGKIMLSLNDAIALALENNLDLAIARYNLPISDTDILRAKAGTSLRGVNTGIVQGTPGGGGSSATGAQGGGAGGTASGAGGAGAGSSGIVTSTSGAGSAIEQFDPSLSGTLQLERARIPEGSTVLTGTSTLSQNTTVANFNYNQGFSTGTAFNMTFDNSRSANNSLRSSFNPTLQGNFRALVSQHLLQGFGIANQRRLIVTAKNNRKITESSFRQQVISTVSQVENIYWDLVNAYEDVKAKQHAVTLAQQLSSDNRKQVQIGTLAPIEIVNADSQVASSNQNLIISQTNLQLQQLEMKNALSRNLSDPVLASAEVIPTDTMQVVESDDANTATQELVSRAISQRPDIEQSRIDLTNREITKKATRNALRPTLDAFAFYGSSSLAGNPTQQFDANGKPLPLAANTGFGDALSNLFNSSGPDKGAGLSLNVPIRNRSAQADQIRSELEYRQAEMRLQQLENQIQIQVRNSQFALQQDRARVEAASKGREFAQQSLDAEKKKYQLGASTSYNVLTMIGNLATSESTFVSANTAYQKDRVTLDQVTGATLSHLGVDLDDALNGQVKKMPTVPNVVPNPQSPTPGQPAPTQAK